MRNLFIVKNFIICIATVFALNTQACMAPTEEEYVLLDELPSAAKLQPVVAKVKILTRSDQSAQVQVIEAIKGVKVKQEFTVHTTGSSCGWLDARSRFSQGNLKQGKSNQFFIAGDWRTGDKSASHFEGSWKRGNFVK
jgi:hypothetical protein